MIVVDTNLIAHLFMDVPQTDLARAVWYRDRAWRLPSLWRSEFLNVLATTIRADAITTSVAHELWHRTHEMFSRDEVTLSGDDILDLAINRKISAYDAHFIAAAIKLDAPLVTADRPLLKACPDLALSPEAFLQP